MWIKSLVVAVALTAGCSSSSSSSPTTTTAPPAPSTGSAPAAEQPPAAGPGIGETCGPGDACGAGLECVSYYGIAGPKGPQFKSCEQRCEDDTTCPKDKHCATIADGPGRVCR